MLIKRARYPQTVIYIVLLMVLTCLFACTQDDLYTDPDARLKFSSDTVSFDTVFTAIGSATMQLKVYNPYYESILISSIYLAGEDQSCFKLNIDGEYTQSTNNIKIAAKDSLYIFLAVTVDPLNENNPILIRDSLVFITNNNCQNVKLLAYGQDVNLINGEILGSETWTSDKPYLIYNSVSVDTGKTLTIEPGTKVYFHSLASLSIYGNLIVNGSLEDPVVFQHDRQEEYYDVISGQWGNLYIDPISTGNYLNHAIIKNAITGLEIGSASSTQVPEVEIHNCIIQNVSYAGIYALGANVSCSNTVIINCGGPAIALLKGGTYSILHCTVSNNGVKGASRTNPSVELSNYCLNYEYDEVTESYSYVQYPGDLEKADFHNCIIYGNASHELDFDDNGDDIFNFYFNHCLLKASAASIDTTDPLHYNAVKLNEYPEFVNDSDRYHLDLQLDTLSPARDAGDAAIPGTYTFLEQDINGYSRTADSGPDQGAYERIENK